MNFQESLASLKSNIEPYSALPNLLNDVVRQGYYERLYNLIYYTVLDNGRQGEIVAPLKIILSAVVDQVSSDLQRQPEIKVEKNSRRNYDVDIDPIDRPQSIRKQPQELYKPYLSPRDSSVRHPHRSHMSTDTRISRASTARYRQSYTFNKEERFGKDEHSPGPGDYRPTNVTRQRSPVSVFARSERKSQFGQDDKKPGPGEYDPINL